MGLKAKGPRPNPAITGIRSRPFAISPCRSAPAVGYGLSGATLARSSTRSISFVPQVEPVKDALQCLDDPAPQRPSCARGSRGHLLAFLRTRRLAVLHAYRLSRHPANRVVVHLGLGHRGPNPLRHREIGPVLCGLKETLLSLTLRGHLCAQYRKLAGAIANAWRALRIASRPDRTPQGPVSTRRRPRWPYGTPRSDPRASPGQATAPVCAPQASRNSLGTFGRRRRERGGLLCRF